ncbi:MAG TPA: hypothetical protein VGR56_04050 [Nitrososphaerales archaeon]|nr:hypothetical protein [Nitrososphaerales archaeon]
MLRINENKRSMRTRLRVALLIGTILLSAAGLYYIVFGAVYNATYFGQNGFSNCGMGCISEGFSGTSVTFSMYPIWSPPSWNHVNYNAPICGPTVTSYTPQNPPPACQYPPAILSPDYIRNYGGIFLLLLGGILALVSVRSHKDEPTLNLGSNTLET